MDGETRRQLEAVIAALNRISVSGEQNLNYLLAAIQTLERLKEQKEEPVE